MGQLPESAKIAGNVYTIGENNEFLVGAELLGRVNTHSLEIQIKTVGIADSIVREALLHEIGHAIDLAYVVPESLTENQIGAFTNGLVQVLEDNPDVVAFLGGSALPAKYAEKDALVRAMAESMPGDNIPWKDGEPRCRYCSAKTVEAHHSGCIWRRARELTENPG